MTQPTQPHEPLQVLPADSRPRSFAGVAWIVIVVLAGVIVYLQAKKAGGLAIIEGSTINSRVLLVQSQYVVGASQLLGKSQPQLADQFNQSKTETSAELLRVAVVVGELARPQKALERLREVPEFKDDQHEALHGLLVRLYHDYEQGAWEGPSLGEEERTRLRAGLGWFGDLALAPAEAADAAAREAVLRPALRMVTVALSAFALVGLLGVVGLAGLVTYFIFFLKGGIRPLVIGNTGRGGIYVETFALWLLAYFGFGSVAMPLLQSWFGGLAQGIAMLLSLTVVAWPLVRGLAWGQVRTDLGLHLGKRPYLEPLLGVATYLGAIPLVLVAAVGTAVVLSSEFGRGHQPQPHPVADEILQTEGWGRLQIFFLACVCAPIVEEIVFRGLLYYHLREASARLGHGMSVVLSFLGVSFLFAIIHPQGLFGVPFLAALATAFTLTREWRGTLVPSIVAHAITNGVTLLIVTTLFSS